MSEPTADEMLDWMENHLIQLTVQGMKWHMAYRDNNVRSQYVERNTIQQCVTKAMKEEG